MLVLWRTIRGISPPLFRCLLEGERERLEGLGEKKREKRNLRSTAVSETVAEYTFILPLAPHATAVFPRHFSRHSDSGALTANGSTSLPHKQLYWSLRPKMPHSATRHRLRHSSGVMPVSNCDLTVRMWLLPSWKQPKYE